MNASFGLIHIYHGTGKGKTTTATGLAIRALGAGNKVLLDRYLKNQNSSELNILNKLDNITVTGSERDFGFSFNMSEETKKEASIFYTNQLITAFENAKDYDMLILDEINVAVDRGFVKEELLLDLIKNKPANLELIMTGRNPSKSMLEIADYVSEINAKKHPFQKGIGSRTGIEE